MSDKQPKDNVWNVLDKVISVALHMKELIKGQKNINHTSVTVKLSDFATSCGYTKAVHDAFFDPKNKADIARRKICANYGIYFENERGGYLYKKMTFNHTQPHPLLYQCFDAVAEAHLPILQPDHNDGQMQQQQNLGESPYKVDLKDKRKYPFSRATINVYTG